jgi:hypothetical protein
MTTIELPERTVLSDELEIAPDNPGYAFNVVGVYQDLLTQSWAAPRCRLVTELAEEGQVQNTWYNVNSLGDTGILLDAVRAALVADVIMVSVYAADELPLDLYVWIDAWLPRRRSRMGALTALIGVDKPLDAQSVRTHEYLQAVARKAQLDFVPQECKRPVASSASFMRRIAKRAGATEFLRT